MNKRKTYLDAAKYMKNHGFQEQVGERGGPRCFLGVLESVGVYARDSERGDIDADDGPLGLVVGDFLEPGHWPTKDAVAALKIAADLAS